MDFKHMSWVAMVPLTLSFTIGVSAVVESPTVTGDVATDAPDARRQVRQNNSTGFSEPDLMVVIDNRTVADGGTITTDDDLTLTARANGSVPINLLVVRVDGGSRRIYIPNSTVANETATLDVNAGEHALEVLIQPNGWITVYRAAIVEGSIASVMVLSSPFRTGNTSTYGRPENNYTIDRSQIQFDRILHDHPDVKQITIELRYHGQDINASWGFRKRTVIDSPNTSTSKSPRLGPFNEQVSAGQDNLKITTLDSHSHCRHYNVNLYVEDRDPSSIEILDQRLVNTRPAIRLTIRVMDQVGIHSVGIR